jgi:hypothetical protein
MHVLLIDVEERNSEKKIPSILGKEKENSLRGREGRNSPGEVFEEMDKDLS